MKKQKMSVRDQAHLMQASNAIIRMGAAFDTFVAHAMKLIAARAKGKHAKPRSRPPLRRRARRVLA
jgi:hypothetical protein